MTPTIQALIKRADSINNDDSIDFDESYKPSDLNANIEVKNHMKLLVNKAKLNLEK